MNYIAKNTYLQLATQAATDEQKNFVATAIQFRINNSSKCSNCCGPRVGAPRSSAMNLIHCIIHKNFFNL